MSYKKIILNKTHEFLYTLNKISKEECEEIQALMKLNIEENEKYPFIANVEGCAHISEVNESVLKPYIPLYKEWKFKHEGESKKVSYTYEFPCYANKNRNPEIFSSNVIIHEDRESAFKCACQCLNIIYFYIVKEKIITYKIEDESTDKNNNTEICKESTTLGEAENLLL